MLILSASLGVVSRRKSITCIGIGLRLNQKVLKTITCIAEAKVSQLSGEVVMVGAASPTNMRDTKTYNVYRDDYTPHGHAVCASLQRLGGPPCPTRADGVRIACDRVREAFLLAGHRPASLLPPNSKKRCVPMTGKQQCERVPGGCGRA